MTKTGIEEHVHRKNQRDGFTLIELLVVISIIALLMSIMMPALAQVKKIAQATICMSNLRHWGAVYEMFADSNHDKLPGGYAWDLYNYYGKDLKFLLCPSAKKKGTHPTNPGNNPKDRRGGRNQAWFRSEVTMPDGRETDVLGSYGQNGHVGETGNNYTNPQTDWLTTREKGAYEAPVLLDGAGGGVPRPEDDPPEYDGQIYYGYDPDLGTQNNHEIRNFCVNRHPAGTINILFLDWHVRKVGLKELWMLKWHRQWPMNDQGKLIPLPPTWPAWMDRFRDPW
jgi:prepilin-type N-terminal cleavage/methylation domain-containing protein/prepilin-type processing-associated H-X9-DG protein